MNILLRPKFVAVLASIEDSDRLRQLLCEACPRIAESLPAAPATSRYIGEKTGDIVDDDEAKCIVHKIMPVVDQRQLADMAEILAGRDWAMPGLSKFETITFLIGFFGTPVVVLGIFWITESYLFTIPISIVYFIITFFGVVFIAEGRKKAIRQELYNERQREREGVKIVKNLFGIFRDLLGDSLEQDETKLPIYFSAGTPSEADISSLRDLLPRRHAVVWPHEQDLPEKIAEQVDLLRLQGYRIIPLSQAIMSSAIASGQQKQVWEELRQRYSFRSNLFFLSSSLFDQQMFFGRNDLVNSITDRIGRRDPIYITGLRKSGKSSFLNIVRYRHLEGPWVHLDMQAADAGSSQWPEELFAEILKKMDIWGQSVWPEWGVEVSEAVDVAAFRRGVLERLEQARQKGREVPLVVVLDEVERLLPRRPEDCAAYLRFSGVLRALAQDEKRSLCLLVADLRPSLNRNNLLLDGQTNPFYLFFQEQPMPPLAPDEVAQMVRRLSFGMGVKEVSAEFLDQLYAQSGGHAFLSRHMAGYACEARAETDKLQPGDLARGHELMDKKDFIGNFCEQNVWPMLEPEEQQAMLSVITHKGTGTKKGLAGLRAMGILSDSGIQMQVVVEWVQEREQSRPLASVA